MRKPKIKSLKRKKIEAVIYFIFWLIGGSIFTALGIWLLAILIVGLIKHQDIFFMAYVMTFAFLAFGIICLCFPAKKVYRWIRRVITRKYGTDATASIVEAIEYGGSITAFAGPFSSTTDISLYKLILSYKQGDKTKEFTTDIIFDEIEVEYLKQLESIKIKIYKNFVAICEPMPKKVKTPKRRKDKFICADEK